MKLALTTNLSLKADTVGLNKTSVFEVKMPGTNIVVVQHLREELGIVKDENGKVESGEQMYQEGQSQTEEMQEQGVGVAQEQMDVLQQ